MRYRIGILAILASAAILGCERKLPEKPEPYDPETEPPPSTLVVTMDPNVAGDQEKISEEVERKRAALEKEAAAEGEPEEATEPPAAEGAPTTKPAEEGTAATTGPAELGGAETRPGVEEGAPATQPTQPESGPGTEAPAKPGPEAAPDEDSGDIAF